jgi:hypothetical protein
MTSVGGECRHDIRDDVSERGTSPSSPSSIIPVHKWIGCSRSFPVDPLLAHVCTQVYRFSQRNPTDSDYLSETDVSKCVRQQRLCSWILLCRTSSWIHIPALPTYFLRYFSRICACWPTLLLQLLQLHPFSSTIQHNSSFFSSFSIFFSLKMW